MSPGPHGARAGRGEVRSTGVHRPAVPSTRPPHRGLGTEGDKPGAPLHPPDTPKVQEGRSLASLLPGKGRAPRRHPPGSGLQPGRKGRTAWASAALPCPDPSVRRLLPRPRPCPFRLARGASEGGGRACPPDLNRGGSAHPAACPSREGAAHRAAAPSHERAPSREARAGARGQIVLSRKVAPLLLFSCGLNARLFPAAARQAAPLTLSWRGTAIRRSGRKKH